MLLYYIYQLMNNNNISFQSIGSTQIYLNSANADIFLNQSKKSNVVSSVGQSRSSILGFFGY